MRRRQPILTLIALLFLILFSVRHVYATRERIIGFCQDGGVAVTVPGTQGSGAQRFQRSYPSCTVTVFLAGTVTLATLYSDEAGTAQANPFPASAAGRYAFYVDGGSYDIRFSGGGISTPFTLGDFRVDNQDFNISDFGAKCDGSTNDFTSINNARIAATAQTNGGSLQVPSNVSAGCVLNSSITFDRDVTLDFKSGGRFVIASGTTSTINGGIEAGLNQIFAGDGNTAFPDMNSATPGRVKAFHPEWWGAVRGDSTVDSFAAFNKAIIGTSYGMPILGSPGIYYGTVAPISVSRPGVSLVCQARMLCYLSPVPANLSGRNAIISLDYSGSTMVFQLDGWRLQAAFLAGINYEGYGIRSGGGPGQNLIDSSITNNWVTLSTAARASTGTFFQGACAFSNFTDNVVELNYGGIELLNGTTACSITGLKLFKNYNEAVFINTTSGTCNVNRVSMTDINVNGQLTTGNSSLIKAIGGCLIKISNLDYEVQQNPDNLADVQRAIPIYLEGVTSAQLENIDIPGDIIADPTLMVNVTQIRHSIQIVSSSVMMDQVRATNPQRSCLYITGAAVDVRVTKFVCRTPNDLTASGMNATYGDGVIIDGVSGEIMIGFASEIYRPRLRCINGAVAGTYNLTIANIQASDSAYDNGVGFACIIPATSGRVKISASDIMDTSATSIMGPFINLANSSGANMIIDNYLPGTSSGGNPKISSPSATTWLSKNRAADFVFASLPAATENGSDVYCSDCNATCAAGGGTGRTCQRANGAWTN